MNCWFDCEICLKYSVYILHDEINTAACFRVNAAGREIIINTRKGYVLQLQRLTWHLRLICRVRPLSNPTMDGVDLLMLICSIGRQL